MLLERLAVQVAAKLYFYNVNQSKYAKGAVDQ